MIFAQPTKIQKQVLGEVASNYILWPKFDAVGTTLIIRISNQWAHISTEDVWVDFPSKHNTEDYSQIKQIVVVWNTFENCVTTNASMIWFKQELIKQHPNFSNIPCNFLCCSSIEINPSPPGCPNNIKNDNLHFVDTFELSTKLLYDLWPNWHHKVSWHPYTKKILFLPGKLRPHRYLVLKGLLNYFPENITFTLNKQLVANYGKIEIPIEEWLNETARLYDGSGIDYREVRDFMIEHETDPIDTALLRINDYTQLISKQFLETTSISVIAETHPKTNFITEKTYACIVAGRPFVQYEDFPNRQLESRGYQMFYKGNNMHRFLEDFIINPNVKEVQDIIKHNIDVLNTNVNNAHKKISNIFPEWNDLDSQKQVDMLTTFLSILD